MTNLFLVRHGQAVVNVEPIIGGMRGDTGLTPLGREQAARLGERLAVTHEIVPDVLVCSTMPRARETAAIIAEHVGIQPLEHAGVCELNPGEADGLSFAQFREKYGELKFDPLKPLSPGGETWAMFQDRVSAAFTELCETYADQTLIVVCHGWVIEASFNHFLFDHFTKAPISFQVENTAITHWQHFKPSYQQTKKWRLGRYNDAVHLHAALRWQFDAEAIDHPALPSKD